MAGHNVSVGASACGESLPIALVISNSDGVLGDRRATVVRSSPCDDNVASALFDCERIHLFRSRSDVSGLDFGERSPVARVSSSNNKSVLLRFVEVLEDVRVLQEITLTFLFTVSASLN